MTLLISDGFESGDAGAWTGVWCINGAVTVDGDAAKYGSYGVTASAEPGAGNIGDLYRALPGVTECWVRAWLRVTSFGDAEDETGNCMVVWARDNAEALLCGLTLRWNGGLRAHLRWGDGESEYLVPDPSGDNGTPIEMNRWYCIELYGLVDASDEGLGEAALYVDGQPAGSVSGIANSECIGNELAFYAENRTDMANGFAVEFDEAALGTERIPSVRGFHVYHNSGAGAIDYGTICTSVADSAASCAIPVGAGAWRFGVRAYNENGEEKNVDVVAEATVLDDGSEAPDRPNRPTDLAARPSSGGAVEVTFSYDATGEAANCEQFNIYCGAGAGAIDYGNPIGSISGDAGSGGHYSFLTDPLADGAAYSFAVRAGTSDGVEDDGTEWASATADASAPTQPASLTARVVG